MSHDSPCDGAGRAKTMALMSGSTGFNAIIVIDSRNSIILILNFACFLVFLHT